MTKSPRRGWPFGTWARWADDTGSLAMALLLTLVALSLSALLVPMVLTQLKSTRQEAQRTDALNAAQAGLDAAIGQIRAAVDPNNGKGAIRLLPCGTLQGGLADGSTAGWSVTVEYPDATCVAGGGAKNTPTRALMVSRGTAGTYTRTVRATYLFETTNGNVPGGPIAIFDNSGHSDLCMDAGPGSVTADAILRMVWCSPASDSQKFAYNQDLTISLVSSKTQGMPLGLCLEVAEAQAAGKFVQFQKCDSAKLGQRWSFNDLARFEGTSNGTDLNGLCFTLQNPGVPTTVVLANCDGNTNDAQRFSPDATAGAGAAGPKTGQLVNFKQFGRCLDVTRTDVDHEHHIVWPCKQAPDSSNVGWNQKWTLPAITAGPVGASGRMITNKDGGAPYCLTSPGSTAALQYVRTVPCPSGAPLPSDPTTWTVYGDTGDYATSYVIKDASGFCLAPTDPAVDAFEEGVKISKVVVAVCNGSLEQKWNAPPDVQHAVPMKDISED